MAHGSAIGIRASSMHPCPVCGGQPRIRKPEYGHGWEIVCGFNSHGGGEDHLVLITEPTRREAIAAWESAWRGREGGNGGAHGD